MRFSELLKKYSRAEIAQAILECYPDQSEHIAGYQRALDDLLNMEGTEKDDYALKVTLHEDEDEDFYVVLCMELKTEEDFALDLTPWEEIVEMQVFIHPDIGELHTLAHILWEITFHGWSNEEVKSTAAEIKGTMEDIESKTQAISFDSVEDLIQAVEDDIKDLQRRIEEEYDGMDN